MEAYDYVVNGRSPYPEATIQKMDLAGSSKYYPQILKGNSNIILIVEGFIDALAAWTIKHREQKEFPTVIVSGGAGIRSFIRNPTIQDLFFAAKNIFICDENENEKDQETQIRTNKQHQTQLEDIAILVGMDRVRRFKVPLPSKDLADYNSSITESIFYS